MAINYTPNLGLALPVTGTEDGTWGDVVNDEVTQLVEDAISGFASIDVTAGDVTLTQTDGVTDEARMAIIVVTGTPGVARNVIAPANSKFYVVLNQSDDVVTFKESAGVGTTFPTNTGGIVAFDATSLDYVAVSAPISITGVLPVTSGGTGLTAGTSGGVLYFDSTNTAASSGALLLNEIVVGGGAGGAPSSIVTGTGVLTALGFAVGSAGGLVEYDGDLGTPSAGDISNCTGTANLNINGTVGATTPNTGDFTVVTAEEIVSRQAATQDGVRLLGRAGGTGNFEVTLTPTTLSADRTLTLPDADTTVVGTDAAQTLTNKNITPRVVVIPNATSITINADTTDIATQANTQVAGTLTVNNPTGTPVNGQKLVLRLQSTNVQTFSWGGNFQGSSDLPLPTTSSGSSKFDYMGFVYNSTSSTWQFVARTFGF